MFDAKKLEQHLKRKSQRGILSVDFIFSFILVMAFVSLMFAFSMTFSVVEIVQYATFASARTYMAAHYDPVIQQQRAQQKFVALTEQHPTFSPLFRNGWFRVTYEGGEGIAAGADFTDIYPQGPETDSDTFQGTRVEFTARVLSFRIPLFGSTANSKDGLKAFIGSYLTREPTFVECRDFMSAEQRYAAIRRLDGSYGPGMGNPAAYYLMMDNGC